MDPNQIISEVWRDNVAAPGDTSENPDTSKFYANVKTYADGHVVTEYYRYGEDKVVSTVQSVNKTQQDAWKAAVEANKPKTSTQTVERNGQIYTITTTTPPNGGQATTVVTDAQGNPVGSLPADTRQTTQDQRQQNIDAQNAQNQAQQNALAQQRLQQEQANTAADNTRADAQLALQQQQANRPSPVSASPTQRNITYWNPATGKYESQENPNFDQAGYDAAQAKAKAQAERDRLSLAIEAGKLSEQQASERYKRWFDENVTLPMKRAEEARARAQEMRLAQEAEDRRKQFAASYEKDRQTTAIQAGNSAANAFNSNLPFRVGPAFGGQFAGALNALSTGGPMPTFTSDAFTFKGPNIEDVARKATARALSTISPYAQAIATAGDRPLQVASYDASMEPAAIAPSAAPEMPPPVDYAGMVSQFLQNNPYAPGASSEEDQGG